MSCVDYSPPESSDEGFLSPITMRSGGLLSRKKIPDAATGREVHLNNTQSNLQRDVMKQIYEQ